MTPLEKAARVAYGLPNRVRTFHTDYGPDLSEHASDAAAIIRAFLEAAAEDGEIAGDVGVAIDSAYLGDEGPDGAGKAAILALKETING